MVRVSEMLEGCREGNYPTQKPVKTEGTEWFYSNLNRLPGTGYHIKQLLATY